MADLVVGGGALFLLRDDFLALGPHQDLVARDVEIGHVDGGLVFTGGQKGRLVDEVGQVGAAHADGPASDRVQVDVRGQRSVSRVDLQDLEPPLLGRTVDGDVPVESAWAEQRRIEHVGTVGRRQDDHAFTGGEAVHLREDLVERLLALVVPATQAGPPDSPHGIDFVDEQDAGTVLLGGLEHVAHPAGAHTHEHLDELRARNGEERHTGLAGDCAGQERLAGAGRSVQEHSLGNSASQPLKLLGVLEELDNLLEFGLRVLKPCHLVERGALLRLIVPLRRTLDETSQDSAVKLVAGAPHEEVKEHEDHDGGQEEHHPQERIGRGRWLGFNPDQVAGLFLLGGFLLVALDQLLGDGFDRRLRGGVSNESLHRRRRCGRRALIRFFLAQLATDLGPKDRDVLDVVPLDLLVEPRIIADRDLGLGQNCQKMMAKPPSKSNQSQGGVGVPPELFGLRRYSAGAGAGSPAAVGSPCALTRH